MGKIEDCVLELTAGNFKAAISNNEFVLVNFYAPWSHYCQALAPEYANSFIVKLTQSLLKDAPWSHYCQALAPEYAKAAQLLGKTSNIKFAKVDVTEQVAIERKYRVRTYPTLKFFRSGVPLEYRGGREAADIVAWVTKKTGPPAKELNTVDEAEEFLKENDVRFAFSYFVKPKPNLIKNGFRFTDVMNLGTKPDHVIGAKQIALVGFFKNQESEQARAYTLAADALYTLACGLTSNDDVFGKFEVEDGAVVLFKPFDEKKSVFEGELNVENIKKFAQEESLPLIIDFNYDSAAEVLDCCTKPHLLFFVSKADGHIKKYVEPVIKICKQYREDFAFATISSDEGDHVRIFEAFGLTKEEVPDMRLIKHDRRSKYKPENKDLSAEAVKIFLQKFVEGQLKSYLLTQDPSEDWDKQAVKKLVGSNFEAVALDKTKDVLVLFYSPWFVDCNRLAPIFDQLGERYKNNESIVIAKIDATANELESMKVSSFPTIKLFRKGDNKMKHYVPSSFNGSIDLQDIDDVDEDADYYFSSSEEEIVECPFVNRCSCGRPAVIFDDQLKKKNGKL